MLVAAVVGLSPAASLTAQTDPTARSARQTVPPGTQTPSPPSWSTAGRGLEGIFTFGGTGTDRSGSLLKIGEYDVLHQGALPKLGLQFWGERHGRRYDVLAVHSGDARDQHYRVDLDAQRILKAHVHYHRFPHRLDHDPLSYLDASSNVGGTFVVRHDDTDPGAAYGITRGELESRLEIALPKTSGVMFFLGHRSEITSGSHQALTTSHCGTCHVTGVSGKVDEHVRDLTAGSRLSFKGLTLDYAFENRRFRDEGGTLTTLYDRALQPATLADVFLNRVQYDERAGLLPFDTAPGLRKDSHVLKARADLAGSATVSGSYAHTRSWNTDTQLGVEFSGASGRFVLPVGRKMTLVASARHYDINADEALVDVSEPIAPAGPSAGLTYAEAYPSVGTVDFIRQSSLSRRPTELTLDVAYRPAKHSAVRFGYGWEEIRRDTVAVERTTTHTAWANLRSRIGRTLQLQVRGRQDWIRDPFMHERAAIPLALQPDPSPGLVPFTGLQYYEMYASRQADLTNFPTRDSRFEPSATWSPSPRFAVTGHYRWRHAANHTLTFSDWQRTIQSPGADLWIAPGARWSVSAGYVDDRERLETMFSTLAFVG